MAEEQNVSHSASVELDDPPLLQAILQHAPYGILDINPQGTIVFSNHLAEFLLGNGMTSLVDDNLLNILQKRHADTKSLVQTITAESSLKSQRITVIVPEDDDAVSLSFILIPYRMPPSGNRHISIFIEDLTGKTALSDAIQFYTDNLESLVESKTREIKEIQAKLITAERTAAMVSTAGGIAHELRQPLTAIIGAAELLHDHALENLEEAMQKKLSIIHQQSLRMAEIIKKMEQLVEYQTREYIRGTRILDIDESSIVKRP
ncbi:MAG: hypothetical protein JXO49_09960 [Deltaproteobacteria bacterium]|nr:hypothetical protein [Candidatus Anaeroferrophillus wilburensis]MBN2889656.1 hypothetical protein [Deltaproteobacteria bacterium]